MPSELTVAMPPPRMPRIARALAVVDAMLAAGSRTPVVKLAHGALTLLAIAFLAVKLSRMGVGAVAAAMPRKALYYAFFVLSYVALPLSEAAIYRKLAGHGLGVAAFLRKRVYNEAVLDYSGEGYLFARLRRYFPNRGRDLAALIKDVNLLSGVVSNSMTVVLLLAVTAIGRTDLLTGPGRQFPMAISISAGIVTILLLGMALFHRRLLSAPASDIRFIVSLHALRLLTVLALQIAQWHTVLPAVPLSRWILFLTVWLLVTRIPFLPNRDLVLASVGITLSALIAAPQTTVAGLFVAGAVLPLIAHAAVLAFTSIRREAP